MSVPSTSISKSLMIVCLVTVGLLLIPLTAMQWTNEVNWQLGDFIIMAILLLTFGSLLVLVKHKFKSKRFWPTLLVIATFLYLWAELAVGLLFDFGS